jgi:hypothetical protein
MWLGQCPVEAYGMSVDRDRCVGEAVTGPRTVPQPGRAFRAGRAVPVGDIELGESAEAGCPASSDTGGELEDPRGKLHTGAADEGLAEVAMAKARSVKRTTERPTGRRSAW